MSTEHKSVRFQSGNIPEANNYFEAAAGDAANLLI